MRAVRLIIPAILIIVLLWACSKDKSGDITAPVDNTLIFIDSTYPADDAVNVPPGGSIIIAFRRPMDTSTVSADKFSFVPRQMYSFTRDSMKAVLYLAGGFKQYSEYTVTIGSGMSDKYGNIMTAPYDFSFKTASGNEFISSIYPSNGEIEVPLFTEISAVFAKDMDPATINTSSVIVSDNTAGTVTYADRKIVFTPNDSLIHNHTYTVTLKADIADIDGILLGNDYSWSFTTVDISDLLLLSVYPPDGATGVPISADISIEFSKYLEPSSLSPDEFAISGDVAGVLRTSGEMLIFDPDENLTDSTTYTITFDGTLQDKAGQEFYFFKTWSFTTEDILTMDIASVYPTNGDSIVRVGTDVGIRFTGNLDPSSVTDDEFIVMVRDYRFNGEISVNGSSVIFTPSQNFPIYSPCTASFKGDIIDVYGDTATIDFSWSFRTYPLDVISWSPTDDCNSIDTDIEIGFSFPLDRSTINGSNIIMKESSIDPIAGDLSAEGSIVKFRPNSPLKPLTKYRIEAHTGIKDIYGSSLIYTRFGYFSTKAENLLPLAIGNKWIYRVTKHGYLTPYKTYIDSIVIVRDSMIDGRHFYLDQRGIKYHYENEIIETSFFIPWNYQASTFTFDNTHCENGNISTINTELGIFSCQHFQIDLRIFNHYMYSIGYNYAPNIGLVSLSQEYSEPCSGCEVWTDWLLIEYDLH